MNAPQTLFDKLWSSHEIVQRDGESLLWVDRHYVHEGSFHAFSRLAEKDASVAEPGLTFGVAPRIKDAWSRTPNSPHPSGILVALFDGSVRVVRGAVSDEAWWSAVTPRGGEAIPLD